MKSLSIDIETYSSVNLGKSGVYKYVASDDFEILLFAYSVDGAPVKIVDLANNEKIPDEILNALQNDSVIKWAFNAQFERVCLSKFVGFPLGEYLNPSSWHCSMIWSATMGLPLSLEGVGAVLGLKEQKMYEGKVLIRYFCIPCAPTKANGNRTRNLPHLAPDNWELFKQYNVRDVEVEMAIQEKLKKFPVSQKVWDEYVLDQIINDRGIFVDKEMVKQAIQTNLKTRESILVRLVEITGLENPNSVLQMREWLKENGVETDSLDKKTVQSLLPQVKGEVAEVLLLRQQLAKSSVKKYEAMENAACKDHRCRGMFQFYGANRTGRFAGRLVQLQNLPQNHMEDLEEARELVKKGNTDALALLYDDIPKVLSELIRTAFIPNANQKFYVADFSAIEARVIAWLAGEEWRLDSFRKGEDIYCASASQMFGVPVEKHGQNSHLRQKGKIAELANGYGGSVGALKAMGALEMGLKEEELQPLVTAWREANPAITALWWAVDKAVKDCIKQRSKTSTHRLIFEYKSGILFITLPSGRKLSYIKPRIEPNQFGGESVTYEGVGGTKKWERLERYGPKFVENIVQGIARDILVYTMKALSDYRIVAHVHDEVIIESGVSTNLEDIISVMRQAPSWASNLLLDADGYICDFYKKE